MSAIKCRVSGCGRTFDNLNAERMHYGRSHSGVINPNAIGAKPTQPHNTNIEKTNPRHRHIHRADLYDTVAQILTDNNGPMSMNNIIDTLRKMKYPTTNYNSLRGQIYTRIQQSVDGPIMKLDRSTYGLTPANRRVGAVEQEQQEVNLPTEVELALLRRDNVKKNELIMGLVRLLTLSVS